MKSLLTLLGALAVVILGPIWTGYVLSVLWAWFVSPTFHAPLISIPLAIGLSIVVGLFTNRTPEQETDKGYASRSIAYAIVYPLVGLIFGAIVHLFV